MKIFLFICFVVLGSLNALTIIAENSYRPFAYLDSSNKPAGLDIEIASLIASKIDPKFKINQVTWNAILVSLDSTKDAFVANQMTKTSQRMEKYIFSNKPYSYGMSALIVNKTSNAKNLFDLKNKTIGVTVGSNHALNLENFLKEHNDLNIKIKFYKNSSMIVADLANERIDGMINDPVSAQDFAKTQNLSIKSSGFMFEKTPIYFMFNKNDVLLKNKVDSVMETLSKEIEEINKKYLAD